MSINNIHIFQRIFLLAFTACAIMLMSGCSDTSNITILDQDLDRLLNAERVSANTLEFKPFDSTDENISTETITISGATFYRGVLRGSDALNVEAYLVINPGADIDRVLLAIHDEPGTDTRFSLTSTHNHKAMFVLGQRGTHPDDLENECPLGSEFVACARRTVDLADFNPSNNGRDFADLFRALSRTQGMISIDGETTNTHTFLGDAIDPANIRFNVMTGFYGATIFEYALADLVLDAPIPTLGRVFINGPLSASAFLVSDGFRNGQVLIQNFMETIGMSNSQQTAFIATLTTRHTAPSELPDDNAASDDNDQLSSAHIFAYMLASYRQISGQMLGAPQTQTALAGLVTELTGITTGDGAMTEREDIRTSNLISEFERGQTEWAQHIIGFTTMTMSQSTTAINGLTQLASQLCSAYILRREGDTQTRFTEALGEDDNNPYWYGYLIQLRQLLAVCPAIADNLRNNLAAPDSDDITINAEALVQYGAGLDERSHEADIMELAAFFGDDTIKESAYVESHLQGGIGTSHRECLTRLVTATYETATIATIASSIETARTTYCGL